MSNAERREGAKQIEEKVRAEFALAGRPVDSVKWNIERGGEISTFSSHTLYVMSGERELKLSNIPDERLEDYPGGVGNEVLNAHIKQLAKI